MIEAGTIIRNIRKKESLSLKQVAEISGITIGYLSLVERNLVSPSLATLEKIASALNLKISSLFKKPQISSVHIPKSQQKHIVYPDDTKIQFLINNTGTNVLGAYIADVQNVSDEIFYHEGIELLHVLEGEFQFFLGKNEFLLKEGDSILFNSSIPHWGGMKLKTPLRILMASTPPEML